MPRQNPSDVYQSLENLTDFGLVVATFGDYCSRSDAEGCEEVGNATRDKFVHFGEIEGGFSDGC